MRRLAAASLLAAAMLLPGALPLAARPAAADRVDVLDAALPAPRAYIAAVWTGSQALLLGGFLGTQDVLRFDPATGSVALDGALPHTRYRGAAVWTGDAALYVGGDGPDTCDLCGATDTLLRYDPAAGTAQAMGARLPMTLEGPSAVWTGQAVLVFGGREANYGGKPSNYSAAILRYDPATDTLQAMGAALPTPRAFTSAVWDGQAAYLFGGQDAGGSMLDDVLRYDPAADALTLAGHLPTPHAWTAAVYDGSAALVFGGCCDDPGSIVRFDPATGQAARLAPSLPQDSASGAAWTGDAAFVFGGQQGPDIVDTIARYDPEAAPGPNQPPVARIAPVPDQECASGGATVQLDGSRSSDPERQPLTYAWSAPGAAFNDPASPTPAAFLPFGLTPVRLTVTDRGGASATSTIAVRVADTLPPTVGVLRPRDGAYVDDVAVPLTGAHATLNGVTLTTVAVGPLTMVADAQDQCGIAQAVLSTDYGAARAFAGPGPYALQAQPPAERSGAVEFRAAATDLGGHAASAATRFLHVGLP